MLDDQSSDRKAASYVGRCGCKDRATCGHMKAAKRLGVAVPVRPREGVALAIDEWQQRRARDARARGQLIQRSVFAEQHGRVSACGAVDGSDVVIRSNGTAAQSFWGWQTCGWADCSHCGPVIRLHRYAEVSEVVKEGEKRGLIWVMATLSPPHHAGTSIAGGLARLNAVWGALVTTDDKSRRKRWRAKWAADVWFVAQECTCAGRNGSHPHWHVLIAVDPAASPAVAELYAEMVAAGRDDAWIARAMPVFVAARMGADFLDAMGEWAAQAPKPGMGGTPEHVAERRRRRDVIDGWTSSGVHFTPAGAGAARYLSKLVAAMTDDELREYAEGAAFELTNASGAKEGGGVSTSAAMATLGAEWGDSGEGRVRRPQIPRWLASDPRRAEIAAAMVEWREATKGQALLRGSPGYYRILRETDFERLDDAEILAKRGEVVRADQRRRLMLAQNRDRARARAAAAEGDDPPDDDPDAAPPPEPEPDDALDSDWCRTVYVDSQLVYAWAEHTGDDPRASLLALHDREGPWGLVTMLGDVWADQTRSPPYVHEQAQDGALRIGRHPECLREGTWRPVTPHELAGRWTPPEQEQAA